MGFLESISTQRIAPPAVTGRETAADLIDHAFLSYNGGRLREVCQGIHPQVPRTRLHRRTDALGSPDTGRPGDELPDPA